MQLLVTLLEQYGLWLVFVNVLALQFGLPVPAYPALIVVGGLSARGEFSLPEVIGVAVAASLVADLAWFLAGRHYGRRVLRQMCRLSLSPDGCVRQTERIYERWGPPSLVIAKFVPGFAAVATGMAGAVRTPPARFVLFDAIGALLWSGVAASLGWIFRDAVSDVLAVLAQAGLWGLAALALALLAYVGVKALQRYRFIRTLRMARVGVDELAGMIRRGERPLIVDVRSPASQREGRIPGAVWIDDHAFEASLLASGLEIDAAGEVIVYCACPNEASAAQVAKQLIRAGFKRVRPLAGGIEAWIEQGYAVEMPVEVA
ncbi:MAG TPA: DedA family protein/thiosulfate sulfurtransferase GlpE [Burkholderiaceae bacterium]|nr:DedA family protein/thiosulfate sulfurtransferase GlpE [Burkholderiaceae bacterium]